MSAQSSWIENNLNHWNSIYRIGAVSTVVVLIGIVIDIVVGSSSGGNLTALPQTAVERFEQFRSNLMLGLYNLDFLNALNQIILIPAYFALYGIHRNINPAFSLFALLIFLTGTILFVAGNTALPMLELSRKYFAAATDQQRAMIAAAGEAMLAEGTHGSLSVFIAFLLPNIAGAIMSVVMLKGKIFGRWTSYFGIAGSLLLIVYLILVTFVPQIKETATIIAAPGGLLAMVWMILFTKTLFRNAAVS